MKVHQLETKPRQDRKRVGRGISAGGGKTAGRGTKGQNSRTGGGVRPGFEGGQNPLAKRLPKKRGFVALNHISYQVINISALGSLKSAKADAKVLAAAGLVKSATRPVKILGHGELTNKVSLEVQAISKSAKAAIEKAGGSVVIAPLAQKPAKERK